MIEMSQWMKRDWLKDEDVNGEKWHLLFNQYVVAPAEQLGKYCIKEKTG